MTEVVLQPLVYHQAQATQAVKDAVGTATPLVLDRAADCATSAKHEFDGLIVLRLTTLHNLVNIFRSSLFWGLTFYLQAF